MPKMKTKSAAKKRFKVSATGRVFVGVANKRHGMRKRSNRMLRQASGMKELTPGHAAKVVKQWLHD
ncbi:MAG: 50S ribosomal protein L35 [Alphaproteobacteria bacterium]|nr:50S ribosomal protein L35 [Alphaproteobacteria bacterium]